MYILEGNIGAGKSTFLKLISQHLPHISVIFEPLHTWQADAQGESVLHKFYQNPHRWAYTIETVAMINHVRDHIAQQTKSPLLVMERSIYSGHYCFAQNDYNNGYMSDMEWDIYNQWFNFLTIHCKPPIGFIYLKTDPEIAHQRIEKRSRASESGLPLAYLQQIATCHEQFLINKEHVIPELKNVPVLVLDCNTEFETNREVSMHHMNAVDRFIQDTLPSTQSTPYSLKHMSL
jgi:deoxyadenosine/deoxycytidine kinase